jgi:hypothetical protein
MAVEGIFYNLIFRNWVNVLIIYLLSSAVLYIGARMIEIKGNEPYKAFGVVFAGFVIGLLRDFFYTVEFAFSWLFAVVLYYFTIRAIYGTGWIDSFLLFIISTLTAFLIGYFISPLFFML